MDAALRPEDSEDRSPHTRRTGPRDGGGGQVRGKPEGGKSGENGWIYGRHTVLAAIANRKRHIRRLILTTEAHAALDADGIRPSLVPEIMAAPVLGTLLPSGAVHQGFAALADPLPPATLPETLSALTGRANVTLAVLDQITDPRNVGAILRSAAAFGVAAVILPERHGAQVTPALAKTASGALETVDLVRVTNLARTLETLKKAEFWCVGLDARAGTALWDVDVTGRVAFVFGSEGTGLRRLVAEHCDVHAHLPILHSVDSLNVSAAAAIAFYEVIRRRG